MKILLMAVAIWSLSAIGVVQAACEIHPDYDRAFRNALNDALYEVKSTKELTKIIYKLIVIDREVKAHEEAHYSAAEGWADMPVYDTIGLYGKQYRVGGCVKPKPGIPLDIAYRAALAPERPSEQDIEMANEIYWQMTRQQRR